MDASARPAADLVPETPTSRLRRRIHSARTSIAFRCLVCIVAYAAALAGLFWAVNVAGDRLLTNAFPSIETVLAHGDDLLGDRFDALQTSDLENSQIVIFDGDGKRLYASTTEAGQRIRATDLPLINEYGDRNYYEVFEEPTEDGMHYRILWCSYSTDDGFSKQVEAWCVLDDELRIVQGNLFASRDALTQREFDFIKGVYSSRMSVERYDYTTVEGEPRTLVFVAPLVNQARYDELVDEAGDLSLYAVPVAGAITAVAAWYLVHQVKRAIRPLDEAIAACRRDEGAHVRPAEVPAELAKVYDDFSDLMAELRQARNDQRRIIADISHDLKTPLTVIYGYATAFSDGCVPPEREQAYHQVIAEKALTASELIDMLFSYAKMEHPEYRPNLERVDVDAAVAAVAEEARAQVEQAGCTLEVELDGAEEGAPAPAAMLYRQLFRRMLLNLIGNACSHNPAGTRIRVGVRLGARGRFVHAYVADTGTGIPPEIAERIFDPFVTSNTARVAHQGTGLGLTIARRCALLMNGELRYDDHPYGPWATVFSLVVPVA